MRANRSFDSDTQVTPCAARTRHMRTGNFDVRLHSMPVDVPSPMDLRRMDHALDWEASAMAKRPSRAEFFAAMVRALAGCRNTLELGSGPGFLAEWLLRDDPRRRLTLIDFSPAMHELARRRLGYSARRAEFLERDFKTESWMCGLGMFDAVVTNQAVHELRHKTYASALHKQVRTLLAPGGNYLVCDHFAGPGGMANTDLYMTIEEQKSALAAAGFVVTEVLRKEGMVLHHASNRSFDSDTQVLQCASRTRLPVAGQLRR